MRNHANFIVALVAAVAVVIVVPVIGNGSPAAWTVSAGLLLALVIALTIYLLKPRKRPELPTGADARPPSTSISIGDVIGAHGQSVVKGNKVKSDIRIFNTAPDQAMSREDDSEDG